MYCLRTAWQFFAADSEVFAASIFMAWSRPQYDLYQQQGTKLAADAGFGMMGLELW